MEHNFNRTTKRTVTYLGVPAVVRVFLVGGPAGLRVVATTWPEDSVGQPTERPAGTTVFRLLSGDGNRGTLRDFGLAPTELLFATPEQIEAEADHLLSDEHLNNVL